jgi:hypothetical protein
MSWNDDDVGYGRPPNWTKFKPGQSGNPTGRPRRAPPKPETAPTASEQDDILRNALNKEVDVTEGGKRRKASMKEVVQQRQIAEAAKGNVIAQRDVVRAARELEDRDRLRARA